MSCLHQHLEPLTWFWQANTIIKFHHVSIEVIWIDGWPLVIHHAIRHLLSPLELSLWVSKQVKNTVIKVSCHSFYKVTFLFQLNGHWTFNHTSSFDSSKYFIKCHPLLSYCKPRTRKQNTTADDSLHESRVKFLPFNGFQVFIPPQYWTPLFLREVELTQVSPQSLLLRQFKRSQFGSSSVDEVLVIGETGQNILNNSVWQIREHQLTIIITLNHKQ